MKIKLLQVFKVMVRPIFLITSPFSSPFASHRGSTRFIRGPSKSDLTLSEELKEVIVGMMLGDLGAEKPGPNRNTRLTIKHTNKQKKYVEHLYSLLKAYCKSPPIILE